MDLVNDSDLNREKVAESFIDTFAFLDSSLGESAFRRWDGDEFKGKFLMSVFEVIGRGTFQNVQEIRAMEEADRNRFIEDKAKALWDDPTFQENSGGGVRSTTRLTNLLPMAREFMHT